MITIYSVKNCPGCQDAIDLANKHQIPYDIIDIVSNKDVTDLYNRIGQTRNISTPFMLYNNKVIGNFIQFKKWVKTEYK